MSYVHTMSVPTVLHNSGVKHRVPTWYTNTYYSTCARYLCSEGRSSMPGKHEGELGAIRLYIEVWSYRGGTRYGYTIYQAS